MNETTYSVEEVADLIHCDVQTLRNQAKSDIAQGRNSQNFNAFQVGNTLRFPRKWIDRKLGIGPAFDVPSWLADLCTKLGLAVEEKPDEEN